jgi:hypothetical protein
MPRARVPLRTVLAFSPRLGCRTLERQQCPSQRRNKHPRVRIERALASMTIDRDALQTQPSNPPSDIHVRETLPVIMEVPRRAYRPSRVPPVTILPSSPTPRSVRPRRARDLGWIVLGAIGGALLTLALSSAVDPRVLPALSRAYMAESPLANPRLRDLLPSAIVVPRPPPPAPPAPPPVHAATRPHGEHSHGHAASHVRREPFEDLASAPPF